MEILISLIGASASVLVAIIGGIAMVRQAKIKTEEIEKEENINLRAEQRKHESLLSMRMMEANTELTICMALNILSEQDVDVCDLESAMRKAQEARCLYHEYLLEIGKEQTI